MTRRGLYDVRPFCGVWRAVDDFFVLFLSLRGLSTGTIIDRFFEFVHREQKIIPTFRIGNTCT